MTPAILIAIAWEAMPTGKAVAWQGLAAMGLSILAAVAILVGHDVYLVWRSLSTGIAATNLWLPERLLRAGKTLLVWTAVIGVIAGGYLLMGALAPPGTPRGSAAHVASEVVKFGLLFLGLYFLNRRWRRYHARPRRAAGPPASQTGSDEPPPPPDGMVRETAAFRLPYGLAVTDLTGVYEGYMAVARDDGTTALTVNVSAERMPTVLPALANLVAEPAFFGLDIPQRPADDAPPTEAPPRRVRYRLDGVGHARFADLFRTYGELLVHDGQAQFTYSATERPEYVYVATFKTVLVLTTEPKKFQTLLESFGYTEEPLVRTPMDTISSETPGQAAMMRVRGQTVYDLVDELSKDGMARVEPRPPEDDIIMPPEDRAFQLDEDDEDNEEEGFEDDEDDAPPRF